MKENWDSAWQNLQNGMLLSEDSEPGNLPSLIRVFAAQMTKAWVLSYPLSAQQRLRSDWGNAQADLSLGWEHMPLFRGNFDPFVNNANLGAIAHTSNGT